MMYDYVSTDPNAVKGLVKWSPYFNFTIKDSSGMPPSGLTDFALVMNFSVSLSRCSWFGSPFQSDGLFLTYSKPSSAITIFAHVSSNRAPKGSGDV